MGAVLTKEEIEERYDGEWVLIGDPVVDQYLWVQEGVVLYHSKDREQVYRKALELRPAHPAILFVGVIGADGEIIL